MVQVTAFAKINLALSVGPPDPGSIPAGMHPIASWMAPIDLADTLTVERATVSGYSIEWAADAPKATPVDWPIEKDLAVRAHRLIEAHVGRALPLRLRLRKRIPVGGGLGGGSADGAAMLRCVNELWDLNLGSGVLRSMAMSLGSDVAFFVDGGDDAVRPAVVGGFGEQIERVERVAARAMLIVPPFGCPTGPVYRAFDGLGAASLDAGRVRGIVERAVREGEIEEGALFNDLAGAAERVEPRLGELLGALREAGVRGAHVTGSGSCVFVLLRAGEDGAAVRRAAESRGAVVIETRLL